MIDDTERERAVADAIQQVASSIAIAALERTLREGRDVTIPSLGITIKGDAAAPGPGQAPNAQEVTL